MYTETVDIYSLCVSTVKEDKECDTQQSTAFCNAVSFSYFSYSFGTIFSFRVLLKTIIFSECYCTLKLITLSLIKFVVFLGKHSFFPGGFWIDIKYIILCKHLNI